MIKAFCDHCKKDLGEVALESIQPHPRSPYFSRTAISVEKRNFSGRFTEEDNYIVACSKECALELDKASDHDTDNLELARLDQRFKKAA